MHKTCQNYGFTGVLIHIVAANKGNMLMVPQTPLSIMISPPLTICRASTYINTSAKQIQTQIKAQIQKQIITQTQIQTQIHPQTESQTRM